MVYVGIVSYILYLFLRLAVSGRAGICIGAASACGVIFYFLFAAEDFELRAYYFLGLALGAVAAKYGIGFLVIQIKSKFFSSEVDTDDSVAQNKNE